MRAYVWTDKALTRHAGRFVWLSRDMERARTAAARKQIGIRAFPTLYVVDPSDGHVAIRWLGGASIPQLERLFDAGELAVKGGSQGPAPDALIAADREPLARGPPRPPARAAVRRRRAGGEGRQPGARARCADRGRSRLRRGAVRRGLQRLPERARGGAGGVARARPLHRVAALRLFPGGFQRGLAPPRGRRVAARARQRDRRDRRRLGAGCRGGPAGQRGGPEGLARTLRGRVPRGARRS